MGRRPMKRWKKVLLITAGVLVLAIAILHFPVRPTKIEIGRQTTYIDGPLNPDGTVNYVAALDAQCAEGVTAENNAAPLLLRAFGPGLVGGSTMKRSLERLGLTAADLGDGPYFVAWEDREQLLRPTSQPEAQAGLPSPLSYAPIAPEQMEEVEEPLTIDDVRRMLAEGTVHPDLKPWLAANAEPLRLIEEASGRPRLYLPLISRDDPPCVLTVMEPSLTAIREAARAFGVRADLRASEGDTDGAWEDVLTAHRLARLLGQCPTLMDQVVAVAVERLTADAASSLATQYELSAAQAERILPVLGGFSPVGDRVVGIRFDRYTMLDAIAIFSRGQTGVHTSEYLKSVRGLDWNAMLRTANRWYDRQESFAQLPPRERAAARSAFEEEFAELAANASKTRNKVFWRLGGLLFRRQLSETVGNLLLSIMMPTLDRAFELLDEAQMAFELEKAAVALAWFHAENGRWPGELAELVPKYLPAVPVDRFADGPLIYHAGEHGYTLYSVGPNLRDDGGKGRQSLGPASSPFTDADDIVVKVPAGK